MFQLKQVLIIAKSYNNELNKLYFFLHQELRHNSYKLTYNKKLFFSYMFFVNKRRQVA